MVVAAGVEVGRGIAGVVVVAPTPVVCVLVGFGGTTDVPLPEGLTGVFGGVLAGGAPATGAATTGAANTGTGAWPDPI